MQGKKTGGRKKGVPNKASVAKALAVADARLTPLPAGLSPLEVMLDNMRHFHKVARDAEAILEGLTAEQFTGEEVDPAEQFKLLLAEVKKAAGLRQMAQSCAADAARYLHGPMAAQQPQRADPEFVPLPERIKEYAREKAINASGGKVVELRK